jgi:pimeloyl-ACP methyl ester carboxylesterase
MGGYIAFEFLRHWRTRVRGLVLMDTRAQADSSEGRKARDAAASLAREGGASAIAETMVPKLLSPVTQRRQDIVERVTAMISATPVSGIVGALAAMRDRESSESLLPTLGDIPTLVVVGQDDTLTPPDAVHAMAQSIPGGRFVAIPDAAHLAPLERPEETTARLREFLDSL